MIFLIRVIHTIISLFLLFCIGFLYYCQLAGRSYGFQTVAVLSLSGEGLVLLLNRWECPLNYFHRKYGDTKSFFDLYLPKPFDRAMLVLSVGASIAILLFLLAKTAIKYL